MVQISCAILQVWAWKYGSPYSYRKPDLNRKRGILRRHRRGREVIGDAGNLLGIALRKSSAGGIEMATGLSGDTLVPVAHEGQSPTAPHVAKPRPAS